MIVRNFLWCIYLTRYLNLLITSLKPLVAPVRHVAGMWQKV